MILGKIEVHFLYPMHQGAYDGAEYQTWLEYLDAWKSNYTDYRATKHHFYCHYFLIQDEDEQNQEDGHNSVWND